MNFFRTIKDSVYNPKFYSEHAADTFKQAFGYFTKLALVTSLFVTIVLTFTMIVPVSVMLKDTVIDSVVGFFPEELTIKIDKGQASANVKQPYSVAMPEAWQSEVSDRTVNRTAMPKNLFVIDTVAPLNLDNFKSYDTFVLISKNYVVYPKNSKSGQFTIQSLSSIDNMTIDRGQLQSWVDQIKPFLKFFIPVGILIAYVVNFVATLVATLFSLLIYSLIVWGVEKMRHVPISYRQAYKLGLYAKTLPVILGALLVVVGLRMPWYVCLPIFLAVMFANLKEFKKETPTVTPTSTQS